MTEGGGWENLTKAEAKAEAEHKEAKVDVKPAKEAAKPAREPIIESAEKGVIGGPLDETDLDRRRLGVEMNGADHRPGRSAERRGAGWPPPTGRSAADRRW